MSIFDDSESSNKTFETATSFALLTNSVQIYCLIELLVSKGIITEQEFMDLYKKETEEEGGKFKDEFDTAKFNIKIQGILQKRSLSEEDEKYMREECPKYWSQEDMEEIINMMKDNATFHGFVQDMKFKGGLC